MAPPERTSTRKQAYFTDGDLLNAAMEEAATLGQSWSMFVSRGLEHLLAIRHPDKGWHRYPEFEDA